MRKIEAVILDWAGTAVDFGSMAPVQAFIEAFQSFGILPTLEEVRKPMGMLKRDHVRAMLSAPRIQRLWKEKYKKAWTEDDVDAIYEKSEHGILSIVHQYAYPKPYVLETAALLREKDIKIGSTTGYTDDMMEIVTMKAREAGYITDAWFSPNSVENIGRPYPYMIYKNMEALKVPSVTNIIKVGDTVADIWEGKNAGITTVGIIDGSSIMGLTESEFLRLSKEDYQKVSTKTAKTYWEAGADFTISNIKDLPELIEAIEKF